MEATSMATVWQEVMNTQPEPSLPIVIITAVVALAVVLVRGPWRIARNVVTIAHEGGHALVAALSGRQLTGVRLHSDTSGVTVSRGKSHGVGMILTVAAGYISASLLGLAGIVLLASDRITALLWISILLLAAMLMLIRNFYGVISVLGTGAVIFLVSWFTPAEVQAAFAYTFTWFMLFAGVRPVLELQAQRSRQPSGESDADQLARLTGLPGLLWVAVFTLVNVVALALGVWLLLF